MAVGVGVPCWESAWMSVTYEEVRTEGVELEFYWYQRKWTWLPAVSWRSEGDVIIPPQQCIFCEIADSDSDSEAGWYRSWRRKRTGETAPKTNYHEKCQHGNFPTRSPGHPVLPFKWKRSPGAVPFRCTCMNELHSQMAERQCLWCLLEEHATCDGTYRAQRCPCPDPSHKDKP